MMNEKEEPTCVNSCFRFTRADLIGHIQVATVAPSVELTAGLLMLMAGIVSSLLTCRPLLLTLTQNIGAAYARRSATMLGYLHIFCGVVVLIADISLTVRHTKFRSMGEIFGSHFFMGIWTSGFFLVSGGLAVGGGRSGNKYLVMATLVSSIISAVTAVFLIIHSSIALDNSNYDSKIYGSHLGNYTRPEMTQALQDYIDRLNSTQLAEKELQMQEFETNLKADFSGHYQVATVAPSVELTAGLLMLVAGILSSLLTCCPLFCAPRKTTSGGPNSLNFSLGDKPWEELPQEATGGGEEEPGHGGNYRRL